MSNFLRLIMTFCLNWFRSRAALEAENLILRQQLLVLQRKAPKRITFDDTDRMLFILLYRLFPSILPLVRIVQPKTIINWHRHGFRTYWRWRSKVKCGRPETKQDIRSIIRQLSEQNPLWGGRRICHELAILGIDVSYSTVYKYMPRHPDDPRGQKWFTFLANHTPDMASMDFLIVPTIRFQRLYCLVILSHARREIVHFAVTASPTSEWVARQITEAFPWDRAPKYLLRDRDPLYNSVVVARIAAMGIRDSPVAPRSPWQNIYVERLIRSIREDCLDHMIILGAHHLHRIMRAYVAYYNTVRPHMSLENNAPVLRGIQSKGVIRAIPHLGGLHHHYVRD